MHALYELALMLIPRVGDVTARSLIRHFGSVKAVFEASQKDLESVVGIGKLTAISFCENKDRSLQKAQKELLWAEKHHINVVHFYERAYPSRLKFCDDAPLVLFYKGEVNVNAAYILSVVGTRNATVYGKKVCEAFIEEIADLEDLLVVSGLAYGIDIAIHQACLEKGVATLGVVAHGMHTIYPSVHATVAKEMCEKGGILTEFVSGIAPDKENFPKRNRIIAGMADATVVVEAGVKGGALITADIAHSYARDVFAFPGRSIDTYSEGCNQLIKYQKAQLITGAKDVLESMNWDQKAKVKPIQKSLFVKLTEEEEQVAALLRHHVLTIDELSFQLGQRQSRLTLILLEMEMKGLIQALPGKKYNWFH